MRVLKFGGTSMTDEDSWRRVLNIISNRKKSVVVVSATDRTTRQLAAAAEAAVTKPDEAKKIGRETEKRHKKLVNNFLDHSNFDEKETIKQTCSAWIDTCVSTLFSRIEMIAEKQEIMPAQRDIILSLGEQLSAYLFAECGKAYGLPTTWVDARSITKTDSNFGSANPDFFKTQKNAGILKAKIDKNILPIIGGFYGENEDGQITTLGFEGSDYSASLIGAALNAEAIEIWTDVSGIFTCDPRTVSSAKPIGSLSFNDAEQLATHGAKVLHPSTVQPAAAKDIPVYVKNIFDPERSGTKIDKTGSPNGFCKAIAYTDDVTILNVKTSNRTIREYRLVEVFAILDDFKSSTLALDTEKKLASIVLKSSEKAKELEAKLSEVSPVTKVENQGMISLVGYGRSDNMEEKSYIENILPAKVSFLSVDNKKRVMNVVLDKQKLLASVKLLHETIFEGEKV